MGEFGLLLRRHRKRSSLSQEDLAERAGLSVRTIRDLESGRSEPRPVSRGILADALGLSGLERSRFADASNRAQPSAPAPAQLPPRIPGFVGREEQLEQLGRLSDAMLARNENRAVIITAISGMGGVGKTALAVHWGHVASAHFPDGQLFVNLGAFSAAGPLSPHAALSAMLHTLGTPAQTIPPTTAAAAAMCRSVLADRRMLVVLDDAASADQVRPLLPASPGCLVLVTSRDRLSGLIARDGARRLILDVLSPPEALALLTEVLGEQRLAREPAAAQELVRACARLPLALRLAAANLLDRPDTALTNYLQELSKCRLDSLAVPGDADGALRSVFDSSYSRLAPDAQRMLRLLGVAFGPDISVDAAAALSGEPVTVPLDQLAAANLVEEHKPGRYRMHDLVREFAWAMAQDSAEDIQRAIHRLADHYLVMTERVADKVDPDRRPINLHIAFPPPQTRSIPDADAGWAWLEQELTNVVAAARQAHEVDLHRHAWVLPYNLTRPFTFRGPLSLWIDSHLIAVRAAKACADAEGECASLANLGQAYMYSGSLDDALDSMSQALTLATAVRDHHREALILIYIGQVRQRLGLPAEAIEAFDRALAPARTSGHDRLVAGALTYMSESLMQLDRFAEAESTLTQALAINREIGSKPGIGGTLHSLGRVSNHRGDYEAALEFFQEASDLARAASHAYGLSAVQCDTAVSLCRLGRSGEAAHVAEQALKFARQQEHPDLLAQAHYSSAVVDGSRGRRAEALEHYHQALHWAQLTGHLTIERLARHALSDFTQT